MRTTQLVLTATVIVLSAVACVERAGLPDTIAGPSAGPVVVASVAVAPRLARLQVGSSAQLAATVQDESGQPLTDKSVVWVVLDTLVAHVSPMGDVVATNVGTTRVIATIEGKSDTATVTVDPLPVASIAVSPDAFSMDVGATTQLAATVRDSNGTVLTDRVVAWTTSNPDVATVSPSGEVTGVSAGSVVITATSEGKSATAAVTVSAVIVPVSSVVITPATAGLYIGRTAQLTATAYDANYTVIAGRPLSWSSSNSSVATVSPTGVVSAVATGSVTVTATVEGHTASASVNVTPVPVSSVVVSPATSTVIVGGAVQLTATPKDANGAVLAGRSVTWASSNSAVATVASSGLVTGVAAGSATVKATVEGRSASATVTVTPVPVASVVVSPSTATISVAGTVQLRATPKDANGNTLTGRSIAWSSDNAAIATVSSSGVVTGVAAGTVAVRATIEGKSQVATITVNAAPNQVTINPGQSIQAAVNANPVGTTFLIKAGTHTNQSVVPKTGDVFIGEPGAILDGGATLASAFSKGGTKPYPSNVTIQGLVIQNYNPALQHGAIDAGEPGDDPAAQTTGWVVKNCEVHHNLVGAGITFGHKAQILNNYVHHNEQIGVRGLGDSVLIEGNEIAYNNPQQAPWGWEGGGTKFVRTHNLVVRGNYVHDNYGSGLWTDINNINSLIEGNRVTNNAAQGIFHEISYAAIIRNNVATGNGTARGTWLWGAGILVAASRDVEIYGNTVTDNANGITAIQQARGTGPYGDHLVMNVYVHDNSITMATKGATGIVQDIGNDSVFTSRNNHFANNTYTLGARTSAFQWMNGARTVAQWKGYGHDVTGIFK
jgi:parallel beta-helix repeat protein